MLFTRLQRRELIFSIYVDNPTHIRAILLSSGFPRKLLLYFVRGIRIVWHKPTTLFSDKEGRGIVDSPPFRRVGVDECYQ